MNIIPCFISQSGNKTTVFTLQKGRIRWIQASLQISCATAGVGVFQAELFLGGQGLINSGQAIVIGRTIFTAQMGGAAVTINGATNSQHIFANDLNIPIENRVPISLTTVDTATSWIDLVIGLEPSL